MNDFRFRRMVCKLFNPVSDCADSFLFIDPRDKSRGYSF